MAKRWAGIALALVAAAASADQVIMKDGTVYKGKIQIDTDKAILIGNPPFDPNSYLLETKDIEKIIYEEYHQIPPAERRRGFALSLGLSGDFFKSDEVPLSPAPALHAAAAFRVHPLFEIGGGVSWSPALHSGDGLEIDGADVKRQYQDFWMFSPMFEARLYPFFRRTKWKTEPYVVAGYHWNHFYPKASGDSLSGSGWQAGFGALHPLSKHWFVDARFQYEHTSLGTVNFLGQEGTLNPDVVEHQFRLIANLSYRF